MAKIEGLPRGSYRKVYQTLHERGLNYSLSLIAAVARGTRRNAIVEEELLKVKRAHNARQKRIERLQKAQ